MKQHFWARRWLWQIGSWSMVYTTATAWPPCKPYTQILIHVRHIQLLYSYKIKRMKSRNTIAVTENLSAGLDSYLWGDACAQFHWNGNLRCQLYWSNHRNFTISAPPMNLYTHRHWATSQWPYHFSASAPHQIMLFGCFGDVAALLFSE